MPNENLVSITEYLVIIENKKTAHIREMICSCCILWLPQKTPLCPLLSFGLKFTLFLAPSVLRSGAETVDERTCDPYDAAYYDWSEAAGFLFAFQLQYITLVMLNCGRFRTETYKRDPHLSRKQGANAAPIFHISKLSWFGGFWCTL